MAQKQVDNEIKNNLAVLQEIIENFSKIKMKVGEGITGWVAETKKTVAISKQAYDDKRFKLFSSLPEDKFEAFLSVPIIFRNRVIGVINVQHRKHHRYPKKE